MTEVPINKHLPASSALFQSQPEVPEIDAGKIERKALRPKHKAAPEKKRDSPEKLVEVKKPLVNDADKEKVFALSNSRGKWTKHLVGQAAWGIPLDSWATVCGWNFAKRNVKVELTQKPSRLAAPCKKCFRLESVRDGVKGAREWAQEIEL